jgi:SNF2 family DNA or RNA helicase
MFQETFTNSLSSESEMAPQPTHINTQLKLHQLAVLHEMKHREQAYRTGMSLPNGETCFSEFGILGDRGGVGKTLMALGHISQMALEPLQPASPLSNLHPDSTSACFSIRPQTTPQHLFDSLIVVPHTIFRQWQDVIETETTLKACFIKSQRDLDRDSLLTQLQESHVALVGNTLLSGFLNNLKTRNIGQFSWRRVFYDEADIIKIPSTCPRPSASMNWLITSNFQNLILANECYHSYILRQLPEEYLQTLPEELQEFIQSKIAGHPCVTFFRTQSYAFFQYFLKSDHPFRFRLIVLCKKGFLEHSTQMVPLLVETIRCLAPPSHSLIESIIPSEVQSMLNAGDIEGALQSLGVPSHTPLTLVKAATEFQRRRIVDLRLRRPNDESAQRVIQDYEAQIAVIEKRIEETTKDSCSICYEEPNDSIRNVITPCCSRLFCATCLLSWIARTPACPLCRSELAPQSLLSLQLHTDAKEKKIAPERLPRKHEAFLKIVRENKGGRFLVFSRYDNSFFILRQQLITEGIHWSMIEGNKDSIANILDRFESNEIQVLFLNNRQAAAGMNIPSATHIILLHKMQQDEAHQILTRAYRLGRKEPLKLIKLLHERE